ncbi:hypothetical protein EK21DRAFT_87142 [Setomelanomma holmii]|uniref:Uncharacterized protein n=1 Tax=Setomelanomma holmii TaxID=210430 RepID=A0A9P4HE38_9PLEO|nr:hypothetical protein EK21DRAFT_87142 [Setomelanomma holmii]
MSTSTGRVVHKIDPDADAVITLKHTLVVVFAAWDDVDVEGPHLEEPPPCEILPAEGLVLYDAPEELDLNPAEDSVATDSVVEPEPDVSELSSHDGETEYHVSSNHLRLASAKFKRTPSKGSWKECIPSEDDGWYHIPAQDWDEESFLILLNDLHLRSHQLPQSVSLEMLAKIAVLVDYYECGEAVELLTNMWIQKCQEDQSHPIGILPGSDAVDMYSVGLSATAGIRRGNGRRCQAKCA